MCCSSERYGLLNSTDKIRKDSVWLGRQLRCSTKAILDYEIYEIYNISFYIYICVVFLCVTVK